MKKEIFGLALALVMVVAIGATALPAMAATEGKSEGSFTLGSADPTVTSIALYELDGTTPATIMDPTIEYVVKIVVADANTLEDIDKIEVEIRTLATSGEDDVNEKATYEWTTTGWAKIGPSGLWSLETSTGHTPLTDTSGEWVLRFKPGPVAEEGTDNWEIYAKVTDKTVLTGVLTTTQKYSMDWRGEISAIDASYSFGPIQAVPQLPNNQ